MKTETLPQELARLLKVWRAAPDDDRTREEAWNLIAEYTICNADQIAAALSTIPAPAGTAEAVGGLDERMKAAGMIPLSDLLAGNTPLEKWMAHTSVRDLDSFEWWLMRKHREFMTMRVAYELGDKDQKDELFEWVFAHSAAFGEVVSNFRAMKAAPEPGDVAGLAERLERAHKWAVAENDHVEPELVNEAATTLRSLASRLAEAERDRDAATKHAKEWQNDAEHFQFRAEALEADAALNDADIDIEPLTVIRSALVAAPASLPDGWVAVPSEPTDDMDFAGSQHVDPTNPYPRDVAINVWTAMLAALPAAPANAEGE